MDNNQINNLILEPVKTPLPVGMYETDIPQQQVNNSFRKTPKAPKRFKSSYILFLKANEKMIKADHDGTLSVSQVSNIAGELWRTLPEEQRKYWDNEARKDKERFMAEKEQYNNSWHVRPKRAKKDPKAPKRNASAFLLYSKDKRRELRESNPGMKNTEVSRLLGELWRTMPAEEKRPHIDKEAGERQQYKIAMAEWKKKKKQEGIFTEASHNVAPVKGGKVSKKPAGKGSKKQSKAKTLTPATQATPMHTFGLPNQSSENISPYTASSQQVWYGQQNQPSPHPTPQPHYDGNYAVDPYASGPFVQDQETQPQQQKDELNKTNAISPTPYSFPNYLEPQQQTNSPFQQNFFPPSPLSSSRDNHPQSQQNYSYNNGSVAPTIPGVSPSKFPIQQSQQEQQESSLTKGYDEAFPPFPDYDEYEPVPIRK